MVHASSGDLAASASESAAEALFRSERLAASSVMPREVSPRPA